MGRVVHFELPVEDPEKVQGFFENTFGWTFKKWDGPMDYWMIMTGDAKDNGIDGGLLRKDEPNLGTRNVIDVSNIDESLTKIVENGGTVVAPKMPITGVGWAAYFKDVEGNVWGLMQADENAK